MKRRRTDAWLALGAAVLAVAFTALLVVRLSTVVVEPIYPTSTSSTLWGPGPGHRIDQP